MIKFIKSPVGIGFAYFVGQTAELKPETEKNLIEKGFAKVLESASDSELPEDFPARETFIKLGITTLSQLKEIEDLTELEGIGKKTVENIDAYFSNDEK